MFFERCNFITVFDFKLGLTFQSEVKTRVWNPLYNLGCNFESYVVPDVRRILTNSICFLFQVSEHDYNYQVAKLRTKGNWIVRADNYFEDWNWKMKSHKRDKGDETELEVPARAKDQVRDASMQRRDICRTKTLHVYSIAFYFMTFIVLRFSFCFYNDFKKHPNSIYAKLIKIPINYFQLGWTVCEFQPAERLN